MSTASQARSEALQVLEFVMTQLYTWKNLSARRHSIEIKIYGTLRAGETSGQRSQHWLRSKSSHFCTTRDLIDADLIGAGTTMTGVFPMMKSYQLLRTLHRIPVSA
jgi:hypothetical protein